MNYHFDLLDEVNLPTAEDDAELCRLAAKPIEKLTEEQMARLDAWIEARCDPIRRIHDQFAGTQPSFEEKYASLGWEQSMPATKCLLESKPLPEVIKTLLARGYVPNNVAEITGAAPDYVRSFMQ